MSLPLGTAEGGDGGDLHHRMSKKIAQLTKARDAGRPLGTFSHLLLPHAPGKRRC